MDPMDQAPAGQAPIEQVAQAAAQAALEQAAAVAAQAAQNQAAAAAAQAAQILRFKPKEPWVLKGDEKDRWQFDIWSFKVRTYLAAVGVTDHQVAIQAAAGYTDLHALRWYQARCAINPQPFAQFGDYLAALKDYLLPRELIEQSRSAIYEVRQRSGEPTLDYVTRFRTMVARVPDVTEGEQRVLFCKGLLPRLRQEVNRDAPADLDTAITVALRLANVYELDPRSSNRGMGRDWRGGGRGSHPRPASSGPVPMDLGLMTIEKNKRHRNAGGRQASRSGFGGGNGTSNGRPTNGDRPRLPEHEFRRHVQNKLCFRCHRPGHRARECLG